MIAKVILFSYKLGEINRFLSKFYDTKIGLEKSLYWYKNFSNPVDITEFIACFIDNIDSFNITMWISLDENVFIKITSSSANTVIKYLFERYPY